MNRAADGTARAGRRRRHGLAVTAVTAAPSWQPPADATPCMRNNPASTAHVSKARAAQDRDAGRAPGPDGRRRIQAEHAQKAANPTMHETRVYRGPPSRLSAHKPPPQGLRGEERLAGQRLLAMPGLEALSIGHRTPHSPDWQRAAVEAARDAVTGW